jgi:hypothetical protein
MVVVLGTFFNVGSDVDNLVDVLVDVLADVLADAGKMTAFRSLLGMGWGFFDAMLLFSFFPPGLGPLGNGLGLGAFGNGRHLPVEGVEEETFE